MNSVNTELMATSVEMCMYMYLEIINWLLPLKRNRTLMLKQTFSFCICETRLNFVNTYSAVMNNQYQIPYKRWVKATLITSKIFYDFSTIFMVQLVLPNPNNPSPSSEGGTVFLTNWWFCLRQAQCVNPQLGTVADVAVRKRPKQ